MLYQKRGEFMLGVNEVLAKVDIVDVIQHYLPIQARGKSLKAVCPFHDDHHIRPKV